MKVDIVTSDDIKIYYTGKFQDFTARYIISIFKRQLTNLSPILFLVISGEIHEECTRLVQCIATRELSIYKVG